MVEAQENLQGPLQNVEALKDVRSDLATKQEVLHVFTNNNILTKVVSLILDSDFTKFFWKT